MVAPLAWHVYVLLTWGILLDSIFYGVHRHLGHSPACLHAIVGPIWPWWTLNMSQIMKKFVSFIWGVLQIEKIIIFPGAIITILFSSQKGVTFAALLFNNILFFLHIVLSIIIVSVFYWLMWKRPLLLLLPLSASK